MHALRALYFLLRRYHILGSFSKTRRRRQRERHQTKGLMSKTVAVHVRFESLYISLPSSANQQRKLTKSYVFWRTRTAMANFSHFLSELNAFGACLACASFKTDRPTEQIYRVATFKGKIQTHFLQCFVHAVAVFIAKTPYCDFKTDMRRWKDKGNLDLSTDLIMWIAPVKRFESWRFER